MTKVRIQFLFLLKAFVALAVLGVAIFFLHRFQVSRQTGALLTRARAAVEADDLAKATRFYGQYIAVRKNEVEPRMELAQLFEKAGVPDRAFFFFEEALRIDPSLTEARKSSVEAAMAIGRFPDAKTHLNDHLIPASPEDADLQWQLGICEEQLGNFVPASQHLSKAFELQPGEPKYAAVLADLLARRFSKTSEARDVLDKMVVAAPTNPLAFVARGEYLLRQRSQLTQTSSELRDELSRSAWQDAQSAIEIAPDDPIVASFFSVNAMEQREFERARLALRNAIEKHPKPTDSKDTPAMLARLYGTLSQVAIAERDMDTALAVVKEGLAIVRDDPDLRWSEAQLQLDAGNIAEVELLLENMREGKFPEPLVRFLDARVLIAQGKWSEAAAMLEESRTRFDRAQSLLRQSDFLLATCYRNLRDSDKELEALRRCIAADPTWIPAREALAEAFMRAGRTEESLNEYKQVAAQPEMSPASLLNFARVLFSDGVKREARGNDWQLFANVLDQLDTMPEVADSAAILRADLLWLEGKRTEAESLIRARMETSKTSPALYHALVEVQSRDQDWEKVRLTLKEAGEALGDTVALRMDQAIFLMRRDRDEVDKLQLEQLASPNEEWGDEARVQLASGFANLFFALDDLERSKKYAEIVAGSTLGESQLPIHLLLFDVASRTDDESLMAKSLEQVKKIEGTGPLWRVGEAIRLSLEARKVASEPAQANKLYQQALRELSDAATASPKWSRVPLLRAEILDRQGNTDAAIEAYMAAVTLGEQSPQAISRAIYLLFDKGRYVEANEMIQKLKDRTTAPLSEDMMQVASRVNYQLQNFDIALEMADGWAEKSERPEDHIWLAQVYNRSGNPAKAEEELRIAISKDPSAPAAWVSLIQFYAANENMEAANQALADAESQIRDDDRDDAMAQAHVSLRDFAKAEEYYKKAMERAPENPALLRRYAGFSLSTNRPQVAEPVLESINNDGKASESDKVWSRRALALIKGLKGNDNAVLEARKLLDENAQKAGPTPEDKRVLARILASRSEAMATNEAISILEEIIKKAPTISSDDNFLLASLYKQKNLYKEKKDWKLYDRTMLSLLGNPDDKNYLQYVQSYAATLTDRKDPEAKDWSDRLKSLAPQQLGNVAIDAELLFRSGDYTSLEKLLRESVDIPGGIEVSAKLSEMTAQRLKAKQKPDEAKVFAALAEELYSEIATSEPTQSLALAGHFARTGDMVRTFKELEGKTLEPNEFGNMIQSALQAAQLTQEGAKAMIPRIQALAAEHPDNMLLQLGLGDYCSWAGDVAGAKSAYDAVLRQDPNFVPALNNLAMILAVKGSNVNEAIAAIDKAVALAGPTDYLLDTRGIVRLAAKDLKGAEADLRRSLETAELADRFFHLALVLMAQGRSAEAKEMLAKAEKDGPIKDALHPIEREAYQSLVSAP